MSLGSVKLSSNMGGVKLSAVSNCPRTGFGLASEFVFVELDQYVSANIHIFHPTPICMNQPRRLLLLRAGNPEEFFF